MERNKTINQQEIENFVSFLENEETSCSLGVSSEETSSETYTVWGNGKYYTFCCSWDVVEISFYPLSIEILGRDFRISLHGEEETSQIYKKLREVSNM